MLTIGKWGGGVFFWGGGARDEDRCINQNKFTKLLCTMYIVQQYGNIFCHERICTLLSLYCSDLLKSYEKDLVNEELILSALEDVDFDISTYQGNKCFIAG